MSSSYQNSSSRENQWPLVSSCIISYAQEDFIEATLLAALAQRVGASNEIIVGDDLSPDNSLVLIENISKTNSKIRVLHTDKNLGMHRNWARTIAACTGKYIAICEGDDSWTDPQKLQKQIDLLEQHPEAAACFSNASILNEDGSFSPYSYVNTPFTTLEAQEFFTLNHNPIPTCTLVFRRSYFDGFPEAYYRSPFADWILHTVLIQKGHYLFLNETTATYRKHAGGVWSGQKAEIQLENKLKALKIIDSLVLPQYRPLVKEAIRKQLDELLYFHRNQTNRFKFFKTWLRLKTL